MSVDQKIDAAITSSLNSQDIPWTEEVFSFETHGGTRYTRLYTIEVSGAPYRIEIDYKLDESGNLSYAPGSGPTASYPSPLPKERGKKARTLAQVAKIAREAFDALLKFAPPKVSPAKRMAEQSIQNYLAMFPQDRAAP